MQFALHGLADGAPSLIIRLSFVCERVSDGLAEAMRIATGAISALPDLSFNQHIGALLPITTPINTFLDFNISPIFYDVLHIMLQSVVMLNKYCKILL